MKESYTNQICNEVIAVFDQYYTRNTFNVEYIV
jgi:hypothetical protein